MTPTPMTLTDHLLIVSDAYAAARKLSRSRVSTIVFGDGRKLDLMHEQGADIRTRRFEAAMRWFSNNWPEGADWPEAVPRPPVDRPASVVPAALSSEAAA